MKATIHELQQMLYVNTPHGVGLVLFLIDYGPHENSVYQVVLDSTGEIKNYNTNQITVVKNLTFADLEDDEEGKRVYN
jgi:hypothetical protein